ncbi:MAG: acyl-coenzyme A thioesterase PaaI-like protein [Bacteriovoracaceae bacterium]|jgi:acyl-coenzyme A thioesterase PaaI-like protein
MIDGFLSQASSGIKTIEYFDYSGSNNGNIEGKIQFLEGAVGQPELAHGGAIFTLIDQTMGASCFIRNRPSVTANINITYKQKLPLYQSFNIDCRISNISGKKTTLKCEISIEGNLICFAEGLFIETQSSKSLLKIFKLDD